MASLSPNPQFDVNVIELRLQLKSAKDHGKNYLRVKAYLVRHLLRNRLLKWKEEVSQIIFKCFNTFVRGCGLLMSRLFCVVIIENSLGSF